MRRMWSFLGALLLGTAVVVAGPATSACACSCALGTTQEYLAAADTAFVGVVIDIDRPMLGGLSSGDIRVTLQVERVTKGEPEPLVTLATSSDGASCGYDFHEGNRYRVYASNGGTGLCSGNELLGPAPEIPLARDWAPYWIGGLCLVLVALAVAGGLILRRRPAQPDQDSA